MRRMMNGILFVMIFFVVLYIFFTVFIWPLEYTTDSLNKAYQSIDENMSFGDSATVGNGLSFIVWAFVGCIVVAIILLIVYLYALAHKDEYESYYR